MGYVLISPSSNPSIRTIPRSTLIIPLALALSPDQTPALSLSLDLALVLTLSLLVHLFPNT